MINIYSTPEITASKFAHFFEQLVKSYTNNSENFYLALSGGSTPKLLFIELINEFKNKINWESIHFFWGDERCVDPENDDSNYGTSKRLFLDELNIPEENIHRIRGEDTPQLESERYSREIELVVKSRNSLPCFDLIILGLGKDGHTASIFPDQMELLKSKKVCEVAYQPKTRQKRITLTGEVINNAKNVSFLITGNEKSEITAKIINKKNNFYDYPAAYINPKFGNLYYYLDNWSSNHLKYL